MKNRAILGVLLAVLLTAGFVCVWRLQVGLDTARAAVQSEKDELLLRSPRVVKKLSLEYAPLMGALYWTRAVQYYGEKHRLKDENLELLWPLLDITTTLDPELLPPYRFGSIFLSDAPPRGAGEPEHAVTLLERGIAANPGYWRLYQDLGNVYYFDMKNYAKASEALETGAKVPGAMPWMKTMAAKIAAEGESLETSYALWLDIYQTVADKDIHRNAGEHLLMLQAQIAMREIDRRVDRFEKETGRRPKRISDLVDAGLLSKQPLDPMNFPYVIGEDGKADLYPKSPLKADIEREKLQDRAYKH
jgi:tetratricopeptide (TPR) repeat protein